MIAIDETKTVISGELSSVLSELAIGLNKVYSLMKCEIGEEEANKNMVRLGRIAVMSEEKLLELKCDDEMIEF